MCWHHACTCPQIKVIIIKGMVQHLTCAIYFYMLYRVYSCLGETVSTIHSQCICFYLLSPGFAVVRYVCTSSAQKALDKIILVKGKNVLLCRTGDGQRGCKLHKCPVGCGTINFTQTIISGLIYCLQSLDT